MDAFDADVLIYAATGHPTGRNIRALLRPGSGPAVGLGSVLLLPEVLSKPLREGDTEEITALTGLLSRLTLHPLDAMTAEIAASFAATYRLRAADATHLATAVVAGADRLITNNRKDFPTSISEIDIVYPDELDEK